MYGFKVERGPDGWRYVKQEHVNGETHELSETLQSAYRFGSYGEAIRAGEAWAERANTLRQYRESVAGTKLHRDTEVRMSQNGWVNYGGALRYGAVRCMAAGRDWAGRLMHCALERGHRGRHVGEHGGRLGRP